MLPLQSRWGRDGTGQETTQGSLCGLYEACGLRRKRLGIDIKCLFPFKYTHASLSHIFSV